MAEQGQGYLQHRRAQAEIDRIDRELRQVRKQTAALEKRRSELWAPFRESG